jgi:Zn-dependent peptidase ImmA (M78 family)
MVDLAFSASVKASDTRKVLGISNNEPIDILKLLRDGPDIHIVLKPLVSLVSGIFLRYGKIQMILVNTSKSLGHQRFTLAHELFHLKYDKGLTHRVCITGQFEQNTQEGEREADFFAANLLLPADAVESRIFKRHQEKKEPLSIEDIIDLEQYFSVSHQAMLVRLRLLGFLNFEQVDKLKGGVMAAARLLGYDLELYQPTNEDKLLSSYAEKAKTALDRGLITNGKYEQLLLEAGYADLLYGTEGVDYDADI